MAIWLATWTRLSLGICQAGFSSMQYPQSRSHWSHCCPAVNNSPGSSRPRPLRFWNWARPSAGWRWWRSCCRLTQWTRSLTSWTPSGPTTSCTSSRRWSWWPGSSSSSAGSSSAGQSLTYTPTPKTTGSNWWSKLTSSMRFQTRHIAGSMKSTYKAQTTKTDSRTGYSKMMKNPTNSSI